MKEKNFVQHLASTWAQGNFLYMKWTVENKMSYPEMQVLYSLIVEDKITQKALGDYNGLPKQTVNAVIHKLKNENSIILKPSEKDKREKFVVFTEKGRTEAEKKLASLFAIEERVCKNIESKRFREMIETIKLFNTLFEKELEKK